jgi:two-component system phosphate regulon sensor histidine kinase PhoR
MRERSATSFRRLAVIATALCAATITLVWFGYLATRDAKLNATLLVERRAAEQLALLWAGLAQDMKGAHATVLTPVTPAQLALEPPYDLADAFARGFARFPYPESFFAWKDSGTEDGRTYVFTRADRPPHWYSPTRESGAYPVDVIRDPEALRPLIVQARHAALHQPPFAVFETVVADRTYQVVVNFFYDIENQKDLSGLVGFTVDLDWMREFYFDELLRQLARIGGSPQDISLEIVDEAGRVIASNYSNSPPADVTNAVASAQRKFQLVFFDRSLLAFVQMDAVPTRMWTARARVTSASGWEAWTMRSEGTFGLMAVAALAAVVALLVTVRGIRGTAELAGMKSDFVSSVTHELKTPLAGIRLIADTLVRGRYDSTDRIRHYAQLLSREAKNLTRLIDNLLAYSRISDVKHAYAFEPVEVGDLMTDTLTIFEAVLVEQKFAVEMDVPGELPLLRADRSAVILALSNVIDNALKYSNGTRFVRVGAGIVDHHVTISVTDRGIGIPKTEIPRVCDKFFRGRGATGSGSGLGLAIVRQIVDAHGGSLRIESAVGQGTRVELWFPQAARS